MARTPSFTELPPPNTRRWVARRKAAVVAGVASGMISLEEACRRYQMSEEEFRTWQRAVETYGVKGLHAAALQQYLARPCRHYREKIHCGKVLMANWGETRRDPLSPPANR
jgi:hypothetical protein